MDEFTRSMLGSKTGPATNLRTPYEPPFIVVLLQICSLFTAVAGFVTAFLFGNSIPYMTALFVAGGLLNAVFFFAAAQLLDLVGKIEYNTREP
jgi:hypothetical protein